MDNNLRFNEGLAKVLAWMDAHDGMWPAVVWVVRDLGAWLPGLRSLRAFGVLEKSGESTRGGNEAYYRMPDLDGVRQALRELGQL